jgi:DNA-binding transcriptional MerR regulator
LSTLRESAGPRPLTRKEAAERLGLGLGALLYYERLGLIRAPRRGANGYRLYTSEEIDRLTLVLKAKGYGLSLGEAAELLEGVEAGLAAERLREGIERKIADLRAEIDRLQERERALLELAASPSLGSCPAMKAVAASAARGGRDFA